MTSLRNNGTKCSAPARSIGAGGVSRGGEGDEHDPRKLRASAAAASLSRAAKARPSPLTVSEYPPGTAVSTPGPGPARFTRTPAIRTPEQSLRFLSAASGRRAWRSKKRHLTWGGKCRIGESQRGWKLVERARFCQPISSPESGSNRPQETHAERRRTLPAGAPLSSQEQYQQ